MRVRLGLISALASVCAFVLVSCGGAGGGGGAAIVDMVHKGDYFAISGENPARLGASQFLKDGRFKLGAPAIPFADAFMHNSTPEMYGGKITLTSEDNTETIEFFGWPVSQEYLGEYLEKSRNWELDDAEEGGRTYFVNDRDRDNKRAAMVVAGGYIMTREDNIENLIEAMVEGKNKLADEDDFKEARALAEFGADYFNFSWDNVDQFTALLRNRLAVNEQTRIENDEDFTEALDEGNIVAISSAEYYTSTCRTVLKLLFKKDGDAETFTEVLNDNKDKLLENNYELMLPARVTRPMNAEEARKKIDSLEDKLTITQSGEMVVITIEFTWEDVAELYEND